MRALALVLFLSATATAQPATDSARVDRVVGALYLGEAEQAAAQGLSIGAFAGPFDPADLVPEAGAVADSVRAVFARDLRPDLLLEALAFLESPAHTRIVSATSVLPGTAAEAPPASLADSALAARFAAAAYRASAPDDMQALLVDALFDLLPDDAPPGLRQSLASGLDPSNTPGGQSAMRAVMARAARRSLAGVPEADVVAATAYYASEAGRYVGRATALGTARAQTPVLTRTLRPMFESLGAPPSPEAEAQFRVVGEDSGIPAVMRDVQQAVVYPESARREGVEGVVVVEVRLALDGAASDPQVIQSPDARLSQAALAAVAAVDFAPAVQPGQRGTIALTVPVLFRLGGTPRVMAIPAPSGSAVYRNLAKVRDAVVYPESARAEGVGGDVSVRVVLDRDGRVVDARVTRSPDERLSQAVLDAVRSVRFEAPDQVSPDGTMPVSFPVTFDPAE